MAEHLDVSGVASLMERSLQNLGTSFAHNDVGQNCCVLEDVFMIILIKLWRKKRRSTHTAIGQNGCKSDHESGILETNSFADMLFSDD